MIELVVIADDFTGALDTGIKFAQSGADTRMFIGPEIDFSGLDGSCEVIIVDSETRHKAPEESHAIIWDLVRSCRQQGARRFYKKTDSALRGCVGAELSALSEALGSPVHFVPALPSENRYTENGVHYIDGIPVSESLFAKDLFEPVRRNRVDEIIAEQSDCKVVNIPSDGDETGDIYVYDAHTNEDMEYIAAELSLHDQLDVTAGCAGFAQVVQKMLPLKGNGCPGIDKKDGVFIVCGTVHEVTLRQIDYAAEHGFERITLTQEQKMAPDYLQSADGQAFIRELEEKCRDKAPVIIDVDPNGAVIQQGDPAVKKYGWSDSDLREKIAERLGEIAERWTGFGLDHVIILSGGDTAYGFLSRLGISEVRPVTELCQGAVIFTIEKDGRILNIVSKSGGFGSKDFFVTVAPMLMK